jgi:nitrogen fixation NifU-like protein
MDLQFGADRKIKNIAFSGAGCAISQASASMLTEKLMGKTIEGIKKIRNDEIFKMLGVPISPGRVKCALLALMCAKKGAISKKHGVVIQ